MNKYKYIHFYFQRFSKKPNDLYFVFYNENTNKFYEICYDDLHECYYKFEDDLKLGEEIELPSSHVNEIHNHLAKCYLHIIRQLIKVKENPKLLKKLCFLILTTSLTIGATNLINKYLIPNGIESIEEDKEKNNATILTFDESLSLNLNVNKEIVQRLKKDLEYLTNRTSIYEKTSNAINKRLNEYDFSKVNETNYDACLAYILFGEETNISKIIASSLTSASNNFEINEINNIFGLLTMEMSEKDLVELMNKGPKVMNDILVNSLEIESKSAEELLTYLDKCSRDNDSKIKDELMKKLSEYLVKKYQSNGYQSAFTEIILSSQLYNGSFFINYNIFSDNIVVNVNDSTYESYDLYYKVKTKEDISLEIYKERLLKLIEEKGNNLDYNDTDCRFLFYLYYLCFADGFQSNYEEILNTQTTQEVGDMMIDKVFGIDGFVSVNKEFLYSYFTSGNIHVNDLAREISFINEYSLDIALYREFAICIQKELECGNITIKEYNDLLIRIESWINRNLSTKNEELYTEYLRALKEKDHIFSKLSIFGDYEYHNENLKQYEYKK